MILYRTSVEEEEEPDVVSVNERCPVCAACAACDACALASYGCYGVRSIQTIVYVCVLLGIDKLKIYGIIYQWHCNMLYWHYTSSRARIAAWRFSSSA